MLCARPVFFMSFQVQLGFTDSPHNKITKNFTGQATFDCVLRDGCSTRSPVILLSTADFDTMQRTNYAYIEAWQKYYYVTDVISVRQGLAEVHLSIDLLMTYKEQILASQGFLRRSETTYNLYFPDTSFGELAYKTTDTKVIGNKLSDDCYIAVIAGE